MYFNEFDPFAAAWIRELIVAGEIPPGEVDERDIKDVREWILAGQRPVTGSEESQAGRMHSGLLDGLPADLFGPAPVRANRSAKPAKEKERKTFATSGQSSGTSWKSCDLQQSLESKLRQLTDVNGSPEYVLTWKHWDMPSGLPICALRARARRTSDKGFTGWPTARANDSTGSKMPPNRTGGMALKTAAETVLAGWATPTARDWRDGKASEATMLRNARPLNEQAVMGLVGWATPQAADSRGRTGPASQFKDLGRDASCVDLGTTSQLCLAEIPNTELCTGVLNPAHSRWLQGYPIAWDNAAECVRSEVMGIASSPK